MRQLQGPCAGESFWELPPHLEQHGCEDVPVPGHRAALPVLQRAQILFGEQIRQVIFTVHLEEFNRIVVDYLFNLIKSIAHQCT